MYSSSFPFRLVLVCIGLLVFTLSIYGQNVPDERDKSAWEFVASSSSMHFYRSTKLPERNAQGMTLAWEKTILRIDTPEGKKEQLKITNMTSLAMEGEKVNPVASFLNLVEFDCRKNRFRERRQIFYDVEAKVIESLPDYDGREWTQVVPKSVREATMRMACEGTKQPAAAMKPNKRLHLTANSVAFMRETCR